MALVTADLVTSFQSVFRSDQASPSACAQNLAEAYASYASAGTAGGAIPTITTAAQSGLASVLTVALASPQVGTPAQFATAWLTGLTAFWLTPPIAFAGVGVGVATAIPGAAAVPPLMIANLLNLMNPRDLDAALMAQIIDTATRTVLATITIPPAGPVPFPLI